MVAGDYSFTLLHVDGQEVVSYQLHAEQAGLSFPHLHIGPAAVGRGAAVLPGALHKVHFPTGVVPLEAFLRLAITEFAVEPRREDWQQILG